MKYQDKDVIVREGAEANTFYIILKGEVILINIKGGSYYVHKLIFKWHVHCISRYMQAFWLSSLSCVFLLKVLVTKNVNGHQKQIRRMGKGEHFGEQALIR